MSWFIFYRAMAATSRRCAVCFYVPGIRDENYGFGTCAFAINSIRKKDEAMMKNNLNQYIAAEYETLKSEWERSEFVEKIRFLMMARDEAFSGYYSNRNLTKKNSIPWQIRFMN